jgi:hypothetical protein
VPNFTIDNFRIPPFLLPIYQAAGIEYGVPWQILAAINEIETDYGRNLSTSSAGAIGWMQFMPSSWAVYGVDATGAGRKDPYNPADAIFAAARYLKAAGADKDLRQGIYAYNHAWWYVDSVMLRARLIQALPADLVSSLTGLTQGRLPVAGPTRWQSGSPRAHVSVFEALPGSQVVAVNDGQVVANGASRRLGRYLVLRDAYGNAYTYSHLGSVVARYATVRTQAPRASAPSALPQDAPPPSAPASAGTHAPLAAHAAVPGAHAAAIALATALAPARPFAYPSHADSSAAGVDAQLAASSGALPAHASVGEYFAYPVALTPAQLVLRPLRPGARVLAGTVLGHLGAAQGGELATMDFGVRPQGAPAVDPEAFVDGWRLLAASGLYRGPASGPLRRDALRHATIGQIMLMSKEELAQRVLADPRISIYPCGRTDIQTGQIDRRVLATLEYLAASDLRPTVSALKCGHSFYTTAGTISEHSYGDAVDIAAVNGLPIAGHQGAGSITDVTIHRLLALQGVTKPHQIISLMTFPGTDNTLSLPDHADHIHVGFYPGATAGTAGVASALRPGQWARLVTRLGEIENPAVVSGAAASPAPGQ